MREPTIISDDSDDSNGNPETNQPNEKKEEEKQSNNSKAAAAGTAIAAGAGTAFGGLYALFGFSSPGAGAGSTDDATMAIPATSGVGTGAISAMQSAGAVFMNAVGGYYAYNNYKYMSNNTTENNQQNLMSQIKSQE